MKSLKNPLNAQSRFEIRLYEGLLAEKPDYTDALMALADLYTKVGEFRKGLALDERLASLCPRDEMVFYNLACSLSLTGQLKKSFQAITKAIDLGYRDYEHLKHDSDLDALRKSKRYGTQLAKWIST